MLKISRVRVASPLAGFAQRARACTIEDTGAAAVIIALIAPVLVGAMGLGAETGYWYMTRAKLQNVADAAAMAVAQRKGAGDGETALQTIADYLAEQSGIDLATTTVAVNLPPAGGAFLGNPDTIEIVLNESVPRFFSGIYSNEPINISARAVAMVGSPAGTACVLALHESAAGAITVTGSANLSLDGCDMVANSSADGAFMRQGNGNSASVACVQTVGTAQADGILMSCDEAREGIDPVADPYAGVPEPAAVGACHDGTVGKPNKTTDLPSDVGSFNNGHPSGIPAMRFCNGLNLKGTVNLAAGLYIIEGGTFRINSNANISGDGVVFYLTDGVDMHFNGTASVDLSAPTSGIYSGILVFGSRLATAVSHTMNGNASTSFNGAIYTPESDISILGNNSTSSDSCTQIIADEITFTGNGSVSMNCAVPSGEVISIAGTPVTLVE